MSWFVGRDGSISVIRVGIAAVALGILFIAGAVISMAIDRSSRQSPLNVEPYPGAVEWGEVSRGRTRRSLFYQIPGVEPDAVVSYYQQKLNDFYGTTPEEESSKPERQREPNIACKRLPAVGNFADYEPDSGVPPYQWTCTFDRSYLGMTQVTDVIIQPGVSNDSDPDFVSTEGMTVVEYVQKWQP